MCEKKRKVIQDNNICVIIGIETQTQQEDVLVTVKNTQTAKCLYRKIMKHLNNSTRVTINCHPPTQQQTCNDRNINAPKDNKM